MVNKDKCCAIVKKFPNTSSLSHKYIKCTFKVRFIWIAIFSTKKKEITSQLANWRKKQHKWNVDVRAIRGDLLRCECFERLWGKLAINFANYFLTLLRARRCGLRGWKSGKVTEFAVNNGENWGNLQVVCWALTINMQTRTNNVLIFIA